MKKTFILFRHGQTDYNLEQRLHGCLDIPLNDTGREQAKILAEKLKPYALEFIYTSPLLRALETTGIVSGICGIPYDMRENLQEASFGEVEGMLWENIKEKYPDICKSLFTPNVRLTDRFPGGESKEEITDRMFGVMMSLTDAPYSVIGISTHGAIMSRFLQALGRGDEELPNTAVMIVEYENGKFVWQR